MVKSVIHTFTARASLEAFFESLESVSVPFASAIDKFHASATLSIVAVPGIKKTTGQK
jgi:hypothetical protein